MEESPRREFIYWNDDGQLCAVRLKDIKLHFLIQEHTGIDVWNKEFTTLRTPRGFNLRANPFERGDESAAPLEGFTQLYFVVPAQAVVAKWLETFKEFPPRQAPASFNVNDVVEKLTAAASGGR